MNLLLFRSNQLQDNGDLLVEGRRLKHVREVLGPQPGERIRVGEIGGQRGTAMVASIDSKLCRLTQLELNLSGGTMLDADLLLALPRPKMARRVIESAVQIGFRSIHLINTWKVDKGYWQSHYLGPANMQETLLLGAEQAGVTCLPSLHIHRLFKPFVEDALPGMLKDRKGLVADPDAQDSCPVAIEGPSLLAIGPEGGFTPYEIGKFIDAGMQSVSLGGRILRVETALPFLGGRLYTSQSN